MGKTEMIIKNGIKGKKNLGKSTMDETIINETKYKIISVQFAKIKFLISDFNLVDKIKPIGIRIIKYGNDTDASALSELKIPNKINSCKNTPNPLF